MYDIKNSFTSGFTGVECTNSKSLDVLDFRSTPNIGDGTPLFINIFSDGGFATGAETCYLYVKTGSTSPGDTQVLSIGPFTMAALSDPLFAQKVALPTKGLARFVSLYFYAQTAVTAGGKLKAFLSID